MHVHMYELTWLVHEYTVPVPVGSCAERFCLDGGLLWSSCVLSSQNAAAEAPWPLIWKHSWTRSHTSARHTIGEAAAAPPVWSAPDVKEPGRELWSIIIIIIVCVKSEKWSVKHMSLCCFSTLGHLSCLTGRVSFCWKVCAWTHAHTSTQCVMAREMCHV